MARKPTGLTYLGKPSALPPSPGQAVLHRVPNLHPDTDYVARFAFPEFTCMCPVTGQPDFAIIMIDYVPGRRHHDPDGTSALACARIVIGTRRHARHRDR